MLKKLLYSVFMYICVCVCIHTCVFSLLDQNQLMDLYETWLDPFAFGGHQLSILQCTFI
jgi:hypothetical protein